MRTSGFERRLRAELRGARPPGADEAERRAWEVMRAAHAARSPVHRRRPGLRPALVVAAAVALAALALSPAGAQVGDWIGDVVNPAPRATPSSLTSLPAPGRLLVVADDGPWIVQADGARRRLGPYRDASWSPGGLFVAAARGHELVALEPDGDVRWTRPAPGRVSVPRWSPDGYRIAYRSGSELWVALGDNARRWRLARGVRSAPPAWKPLAAPAEQVLAFAAGRRVRIVAVDSRRQLGATRPAAPPRELWWGQDGRRLVSVTTRAVRVYGRRGRLLAVRQLPAGLRAAGSALAPDGRRLAIIAKRPRGRTSALLLLRIDRAGPPAELFTARTAFEGLTWSIDGKVVVLGLPEADQWLFLRPAATGGVESVVRHVRGRFAGAGPARTGAFPRPAGWCYPEPVSSVAHRLPPCSSGATP